MIVFLAKSRSAKTVREVGLIAMQTCVEKHTQPCLAVRIQTQLLEYLCMHLQPCY